MLLESLRYVRIMVYEPGSLMPLKAASAKGVMLLLSLNSTLAYTCQSRAPRCLDRLVDWHKIEPCGHGDLWSQF